MTWADLLCRNIRISPCHLTLFIVDVTVEEGRPPPPKINWGTQTHTGTPNKTRWPVIVYTSSSPDLSSPGGPNGRGRDLRASAAHALGPDGTTSHFPAHLILRVGRVDPGTTLTPGGLVGRGRVVRGKSSLIRVSLLRNNRIRWYETTPNNVSFSID